MKCPRQIESGLFLHTEYDPLYRPEDDSCSHCGSLNPDTLMARIEAGTVELSGTDKNYKVYVKNAGGDPFKQHYRECPSGAGCTLKDCTHWTTRNIEETKFYFQHLSAEQQQRFVALFNEGKMKFSWMFYVWPYFMRPVSQ